MTENSPPQKTPLIFFRSGKGAEPVREWLKELPEAERHAVGKDLLRAQWRWPVGMPLCRPLGGGLWEIRTDLPTKRTARVFVVPIPRAFSGAARLHQENAGNARRGFSIGAQASEGVNEMSKKRMGSSIDDFLKTEGDFEEAQSQAVKEVVAWQLAQAMKEKKISKNRMATLLKTSRTQVDRLLDAKNDITLSSLERAAAMVGRRVTIQLV
jgi:predicted XRE-type DNA-binding protein